MKPMIGVIGAGLMGMGMALRLLDGRWPLMVRDIDALREAQAAAAGAQVATDAAALGAQCALVIVAVVDAAQTEQVLFGPAGAAGAMQPGGCVMLSPTIAPADTERFAARLDQMGLACMDAPMSGGPLRARDGSMSLMVACGDDVFDPHQVVLAWLSSRLFRVGSRPGDGARTKLVNNLLAATNLAAACEAMLLAEELGLDARRTLAVIEQSSGQSWIGHDRMSRVLADDPAVLAHMALLAKDSALAMGMAAAIGCEPALGGQAASWFRAACQSGRADQDDAQLLNWLRARSAHPAQ